MKTLTDFPNPVQEIEHIEVPMPDGCKLAARIWMPEDATENPVPAILEYIPYRKNDYTLARDTMTHPYIAGHGYAVVRLDLRGAGDSEGLMRDEYLEQELQDGFDAIEWIAGQDWCDGNLGMYGISWGGFNGLQVAAKQPPALKAIITACSTDDRYADDIHYMGGCMLIDQLSWSSVMFGRNTLPPDPRNVGDKWRDMWRDRLEHSGLWLKKWLEHQTRDAYWKHGSVCENYADIQVPVYAVSGWADGYCRSVFRLMENLDVPRKGLVGPWVHAYPHIAEPGPAIGFLRECLRWWDQWLKGRDTGIMDEPMLRLYMQDGAPPRGWYEHRDGRWVAEPSWPSPNIKRVSCTLGADGVLSLDGAELPNAALEHSTPLHVGMQAGKWCPFGLPGDQPADQRPDDAASLCFETRPLSEDVEIAGDTNLKLTLSVDRPVAQVAARLVDVAPDGAATRVAFGVLNLTHRNGHETPEALIPGEKYTVTVPFKPVAQRFARGHRMRLAVSTNYFPMIWPTPEPVTMTVYTGEMALELPVRAASPEDVALPPFGDAEAAPPLEKELIEDGEAHWRIVHDIGADSYEMQICDGAGTTHIVANDLTISDRGEERYAVCGNDFSGVTGEVCWEYAMSRGDWSVRSVTETRLTADAQSWHIEARLRAWEGDELAHEQIWDERILRHMG